MRDLTDDIRHETQRGVILMILVRRGLDWVPFAELQQQLLRAGIPADRRRVALPAPVPGRPSARLHRGETTAFGAPPGAGAFAGESHG